MTKIKNIYGEVIFTSANRNDTSKESVEQAVEANVSLMKAKLRDANLQEANLRGAKLREADLQNADLWRANLQNADLRGADLQDAQMQRADLRGAKLQGANLHNAKITIGNRVFTLKEETNVAPEVWKYGPVFSKLYRAMRGFGGRRIKAPIVDLFFRKD